MKLTKTGYIKLLQDLSAAQRLFDYMFQMMPDEDCGIPYRGSVALQDLQDYLWKNIEIID